MSDMLLQKRIRSEKLKNRVTSPEKAARFVKDGMTLGIGAAPSSACPKTFFTALAKELKDNGKITLLTGGPVPYEVDGLLTEEGIFERRFGQSDNKQIFDAANDRSIAVIDTRTGILPSKVINGCFGKIDIVVIQATAITEEGFIIPTTTCLDAPSYASVADKIIVEINLDVPESIEGIHDIYIPEAVPFRNPIPLKRTSDRIGSKYIEVDPEKIVAIIGSDMPDNPPPPILPDAASQNIAALLLDFFQNEVRCKRLPPNLLPLQFGIGKIPEAITKSLSESSFMNMEIYTGVIGDGLLDLIDAGKVKSVSTSGLYLSDKGFDRFYRNLSKYKEFIIIRPIVIADCPEIIARLGCIAINGAIEVDIYGHANSTHINGNTMVSGIGGSGEFLWNSYLSILLLPSVAKDNISRVVPMVTHVDHPEHCIDIIITEQGWADLRWLSPTERAQMIIDNCAHPQHKLLLKEYLMDALKMRGGHEPQILERAFQFHINPHGLAAPTKDENINCYMP